MIKDTSTLTGDFIPRLPLNVISRRDSQSPLKYYEWDGLLEFSGRSQVHDFAHRLNQRYGGAGKSVRSGEVLAMALLLEASRRVLLENLGEGGWTGVSAALDETVWQRLLKIHWQSFPPMDAAASFQTYLRGHTRGISHELRSSENLMLLRLAQYNPAFQAYAGFYESEALEEAMPLRTFWQRLETVQASGGKSSTRSLASVLTEPMRAHPHSLEAQLEWVLANWSRHLGAWADVLRRALDVLHEEAKVGLHGPGPVQKPDLSLWDEDVERFTADQDWMPSVVLMAKNVYVWLHQLSAQYQRAIERLDQIPDEVLETLSRDGFTALWLIGIWERSTASKEIKRRMGNPEAEASAYALWDYDVAHDLGGWPAFENLSQRAWRHGIRMAGDMVPNHTGIDGRWVAEHPDWFIQLDEPPFPSYTFGSENLSRDSRMAIHLEDHYYNKSDAAVVFKHVEHATGRVRYIYHGNDGTTMPWNDTAQINFLHPEAREAVAQAILHVARHFPVIRLDAAMTLVKKHIQRLWFPPPGEGGDIASRSEHGLSREAFNAAMPQEFWREVVDRVAAESPDTLLLAEAFWMLEGYFVRSLGMHRVYNSAFMNMLKMEKNDEYQAVIRETLSLNPEILKRYVNFMSNPDEDTALAQFGKEDKYFAVCTLMATLPGLPMFGHGQIEGFAEKYGMEYRRSYWDEHPDLWLRDRHEREIFPLLKRRPLFAHVEHFGYYPLKAASGHADNVFAFSNRWGHDRVVVAVHNVYGDASGWIRETVPYQPHGREELLQSTLSEMLDLPSREGEYVVFRAFRSGLQHIVPISQIEKQGLYFDLSAYDVQIFMDFKVVADSADRPYAELTKRLAGRGVADVEQALRELRYEDLRAPLQALFDAAALNDWMDKVLVSKPAGTAALVESYWKSGLMTWRKALPDAVDGPDDFWPAMKAALMHWVEAVRFVKEYDPLASLTKGAWGGVLVPVCLMRRMALSPETWHRWTLDSLSRDCLSDLDLEAAPLVPLWVHSLKIPGLRQDIGLAAHLSADEQTTLFQVNEHEGRSWFRQEAMSLAAGTTALLALIDAGPAENEMATLLPGLMQLYDRIEKSGYDFERFRALESGGDSAHA